MSDEHKSALAEGRDQGRAVRRYLEALEAHKPKRGRWRSPESMIARLEGIEAELPTADPLERLHRGRPGGGGSSQQRCWGLWRMGRPREVGGRAGDGHALRCHLSPERLLELRPRHNGGRVGRP